MLVMHLSQVAETLIKKVLAPPSQKTKLIEAKEHDADEKVYYTIESVAQAPNFTCHAPSAITIGSGIMQFLAPIPSFKAYSCGSTTISLKEIWNNWFAVILLPSPSPLFFSIFPIFTQCYRICLVRPECLWNFR